MWVFSHFLGVDLKRNTKNPCCLFVFFGKHHIDLLYSSVAKRFSVLLIGKQTAQGSFHNFISICLHLHFSLSVLLSLAVFLSAFIKLAWLSPARQIPPSIWKDTHLPCSQIPAMFSGNITLLLKSSHGRGRSFFFRAKRYKLFKKQTPKWQSPVGFYLHERKTHSVSEWETWETVDVLWIFVWRIE